MLQIQGNQAQQTTVSQGPYLPNISLGNPDVVTILHVQQDVN